jgi:hypothetical protein
MFSKELKGGSLINMGPATSPILSSRTHVVATIKEVKKSVNSSLKRRTHRTMINPASRQFLKLNCAR